MEGQDTDVFLSGEAYAGGQPARGKREGTVDLHARPWRQPLLTLATDIHVAPDKETTVEDQAAKTVGEDMKRP